MKFKFKTLSNVIARKLKKWRNNSRKKKKRIPSILVVQKSPEKLINGEYHGETRVTEWGTTWDALVSRQKIIQYVNPPTLSSTASATKSMDLSARPTTFASLL
ncbi:hypothetical protein ACOWPH_00415 [Anabaena sp. PCC 7938]|uniref:hypothetical protein n=2 Tax=Nostocaceae TaxID=1162 RepID=UPI000B5DF537|nr:hypothetical protein [Anabaena sp. CCAP 1446/1C]MBY5285118.1 hypothetical protein [Anabaena sp. CCAP 1446/1C]MBY5308850.1 hypothetical protein [Anabaena sp. CCAP 1446/1C]MCM2409491.1 hypothetical protein [Anabaena sp. CCAP 1446/1C]BAY06247.1 hypothetical protein NIES19_55300 [Anabaena cylindrica PCC 7122]